MWRSAVSWGTHGRQITAGLPEEATFRLRHHSCHSLAGVRVGDVGGIQGPFLSLWIKGCVPAHPGDLPAGGHPQLPSPKAPGGGSILPSGPSTTDPPMAARPGKAPSLWSLQPWAWEGSWTSPGKTSISTNDSEVRLLLWEEASAVSRLSAPAGLSFLICLLGRASVPHSSQGCANRTTSGCRRFANSEKSLLTWRLLHLTPPHPPFPSLPPSFLHVPDSLVLQNRECGPKGWSPGSRSRWGSRGPRAQVLTLGLSQSWELWREWGGGERVTAGQTRGTVSAAPSAWSPLPRLAQDLLPHFP